MLVYKSAQSVWEPAVRLVHTRTGSTEWLRPSSLVQERHRTTTHSAPSLFCPHIRSRPRIRLSGRHNLTIPVYSNLFLRLILGRSMKVNLPLVVELNWQKRDRQSILFQLVFSSWASFHRPKLTGLISLSQALTENWKKTKSRKLPTVAVYIHKYIQCCQSLLQTKTKLENIIMVIIV